MSVLYSNVLYSCTVQLSVIHTVVSVSLMSVVHRPVFSHVYSLECSVLQLSTIVAAVVLCGRFSNSYMI